VLQLFGRPVSRSGSGSWLLSALTLLLVTGSLWSLGSAGYDYGLRQTTALAAHQRCLANLQRQNQTLSGVWPCWHSKLALQAFEQPGAPLVGLAPSNPLLAVLYLATCAVLVLWLVSVLKQRQRHAYQTRQGCDPN